MEDPSLARHLPAVRVGQLPEPPSHVQGDPRPLRAEFIHRTMSLRGVQVAFALGATAASATVRARVSPKTLTALTRPRLIACASLPRATPSVALSVPSAEAGPT